LNSAILAAATGLLKFDNPPAVYLFIALLFALGCAISGIGSKAINKNHEYYRRTIVKKTVIENLLGLNDPVPSMTASHSLAVGTTTGQNDQMQILRNPEGWVGRKLRRSAITYWLRAILIAVAIVDLIGVITSASMMVAALDK
jgi:hypothetical protein